MLSFSSVQQFMLNCLLCSLLSRYSHFTFCHDLKYPKTLHLSYHYTLLNFFLMFWYYVFRQVRAQPLLLIYRKTKISVWTNKNSEPALTSAHRDQAGYYYTRRTHRNKFKKQVFDCGLRDTTGTLLLLTPLCNWPL